MRKYSDLGFGDPPDRPAWVDGIDNPYLHGPYTPVVDEHEAESLQVLAGEIPDALAGGYFRQGPHPVLPPRDPYHRFA
ncbi:MAG: dioxygenase, partial [Steroidobacteraceae bacterium]